MSAPDVPGRFRSSTTILGVICFRRSRVESPSDQETISKSACKVMEMISLSFGSSSTLRTYGFVMSFIRVYDWKQNEKSCAFAGFAFDDDPSMHQIHQLFRDGKSQPHTFVIARDGRV